MNVAVIGSGYVGLVSAAVFADLGNRVYGVDIDEGRVQGLNRGQVPIYEPGLEEMIVRNQRAGRLSFTTDAALAVRECPMILIAVGTPPAADGSTDLTQVEEAARAIARAATGRKIVVSKSTVPVGTGELVRDILASSNGHGAEFVVLSNPEFLREGSAVQDALHPDRVIIGAPSPEAAEPLCELYRPLACPVLVCDVASAEMIKYASNALLASRISFVNMLADLCEEAGADIRVVAKGMGYDHRINPHFLNAGIGYGGSCFPKDVESLIAVLRARGCAPELLEAVHTVNLSRVPRLVNRLAEALGGLAGKTVAVLGLTFKPNTDDLRESRAIDLCRALLDAGVTVRAHDPVAMGPAAAGLHGLICCANPLEAVDGADAVVLATEWNEYAQLDLPALRAAMRGDLLADARNLYQPEQVEGAGFRYIGIGRAFAVEASR
ncbi:MAG: UDP-glucose dehydrogenase family protein [Armatimonadota bacterium]